MTRWLSAMLIAVVAFHGSPVAARDVGEKIGPVLMNPGSPICDTVEQAKKAIEADGPVEGCGRLSVPLPVLIEVIDHFEGVRGTFSILRVLFITQAALGVQYGWILDSDKGASA